MGRPRRHESEYTWLQEGNLLPLSRNQKYKKDSPRKKEGSPFLHGRDWRANKKAVPEIGTAFVLQY